MNKYLEERLVSGYPVVFDYDGVLFEVRWYEKTINMYNETYEKLVAAYARGENLLSKPIMSMKTVVDMVTGDKYVLSHMHHQIEHDNKKKQIAKFFPQIPVENVLRSNTAEGKIDYLEEIYKKYNGFVYIDDNHNNLMLYENYFWGRENVNFFHISSVYV